MCSSERCIKNHQSEYDILPSYRKSNPSAYWMTYKCPTRGTGPWGGPSQVYTLSLLLRVRPHIDTLTADWRTHLIQPGQSDSAPGGVGSRLRQHHSLLLVKALGRQTQQLRTCYISSYSWSLGELFFRVLAMTMNFTEGGQHSKAWGPAARPAVLPLGVHHVSWCIQ